MKYKVSGFDRFTSKLVWTVTYTDVEEYTNLKKVVAESVKIIYGKDISIVHMGDNDYYRLSKGPCLVSTEFSVSVFPIPNNG